MQLIFQKYSKLIYFAITLIILNLQCKEFKQWAFDWQKKQIEKRYGEAYIDPDDIPKWQDEVREYEKEIEKKINAGVKLANLYRKIGEAFSKIESFELCAENLEKSIEYGNTKAAVFYELGLCYGNLAQRHAWQYNFAQKAERAFLKTLNLKPEHSRAKFELGLIYFYGLGKNNQYSVLGSQITVSQQLFREKAIELVTMFQSDDPNNVQSYFALAGMYKLMGKIDLAADQMQSLMSIIEKQQPNNFAKNDKYIKAQENLNALSLEKSQ